jgi:scyllo-inositol 2-dehydrogenase (NADP+)
LLEEDKVFGELSEFESRYDRWRPELKGGTWKEESGWGRGIVFDLGSHIVAS